MSVQQKLKWSYVKALCWIFMALLFISTFFLTLRLLQLLPKLSQSNSSHDIIAAFNFINTPSPSNNIINTTILSITDKQIKITKNKSYSVSIDEKTMINPSIKQTPIKYKNRSKISVKIRNIDKLKQMHDLSPLYDNPFKLKKCRNALSDKYGMDAKSILNKTAHCRQFSGILSRENWDRLISSKRRVLCPLDQRSAIRTHELQINRVVYKQKPYKNMSWLTDIYPIYFMIAKSGSTSIFGYLQEYNRYFGYDKYGSIGHKIAVSEKITVIQSKCSFTFVRDPITRFISAYYTINGLLWLALKEKFVNILNDTFLKYELPFNERKRQKFVKFASIKGEPMRLKMFINELTEKPYYFTRLWQIDHIQSQTEILSIYFGRLKSKLHFIGKQEKLEKHWNELVKICHVFFKNNSNVIFNDKKHHKKKQLQGFGWKAPGSWNKDYHRFKDFIEYLSLQKVYQYYLNNKDEKNNVNMDVILPPIWYYIDEKIYNQIVEYYYMDYQCFGYVPNYQQFVAKREQYINIYHV